MRTFKELWAHEIGTSLRDTKAMAERSVAAIGVSTGGLAQPESDALAGRIGDVLVSERFSDALASEVGLPRPGETEEEYIDRAAAVSRRLLARDLENP